MLPFAERETHRIGRRLPTRAGNFLTSINTTNLQGLSKVGTVAPLFCLLSNISLDMQRFQMPYNLKGIPEVQDYLNECFEKSKHHGDLQDLYRRRYVHLAKYIPSLLLINPNIDCQSSRRAKAASWSAPNKRYATIIQLGNALTITNYLIDLIMGATRLRNYTLFIPFLFGLYVASPSQDLSFLYLSLGYVDILLLCFPRMFIHCISITLPSLCFCFFIM